MGRICKPRGTSVSQQMPQTRTSFSPIRKTKVYACSAPPFPSVAAWLARSLESESPSPQALECRTLNFQLFHMFILDAEGLLLPSQLASHRDTYSARLTVVTS
jgi:hypothetical protein